MWHEENEQTVDRGQKERRHSFLHLTRITINLVKSFKTV